MYIIVAALLLSSFSFLLGLLMRPAHRVARSPLPLRPVRPVAPEVQS